MNRLAHKTKSQHLRKARVRARVNGASNMPRLSVFISNHHITAQVIDDSKGKTLVYATTVGSKTMRGSMTEKAEIVGAEIGKNAKAAKIKRVVFDRGSRLYHGRVKALADAARKQGLEF